MLPFNIVNPLALDYFDKGRKYSFCFSYLSFSHVVIQQIPHILVKSIYPYKLTKNSYYEMEDNQVCSLLLWYI